MIANKTEVRFSQVELVNLLAGVVERTRWVEMLSLVSKLKEDVGKMGIDSSEFRAEMKSFENSILSKINSIFQESTKALDGANGFPLFQENGSDADGYPIYTSLYDPENHYQPLLRPDIFAEDNLKTPMNVLSNQLGELRESVVFKRITEKIKDGYDPFVVFGNSHVIKQAPAIEYIYKNMK